MVVIESERDAHTAFQKVEEHLARYAGLLRVSADPDEQQLWLNHDLASLAENRLGLRIEPGGLTATERRELIQRASLEHEGLGRWQAESSSAYWLVHGTDRVGTVALSRSLLGHSLLGVSSLHVHSARRREGHAARALEAIFAASLAADLSGIRLSTDFSWQLAVRFYLKLGFWVRSWKRSLDFVRRKDLPPWHVTTAGDVASFIVVHENEPQVLIEARRAGRRLDWVETLRAESARGEVAWLAPGTFALALAVRGFPLITSDAAWAAQLKRGFSDLGGPEGLAFKIRRFEAWDRKHGWITPAPRIPGLDYPDWDALG
jgi:ribosomal protein S18 acetylase RimI-like enzyme